MIEEGPLPGTALLQKYARSGAYTDCFHTSILENVSLEDYVEAFYTTWLFKLERLILKLAIKRPSTDEQARQVASGEIERFAAWRVEGRDQHQLLMSDFRDHTRSWFMVVPGALVFWICGNPQRPAVLQAVARRASIIFEGVASSGQVSTTIEKTGESLR